MRYNGCPLNKPLQRPHLRAYRITLLTMGANMPAKLYRVEEVSAPGILPAGTYVALRDGRVIMEVEVKQPTRPRDLIPLVRRTKAA